MPSDDANGSRQVQGARNRSAPNLPGAPARGWIAVGLQRPGVPGGRCDCECSDATNRVTESTHAVEDAAAGCRWSRLPARGVSRARPVWSTVSPDGRGDQPVGPLWLGPGKASLRPWHSRLPCFSPRLGASGEADGRGKHQFRAWPPRSRSWRARSPVRDARGVHGRADRRRRPGRLARVRLRERRVARRRFLRRTSHAPVRLEPRLGSSNEQWAPRLARVQSGPPGPARIRPGLREKERDGAAGRRGCPPQPEDPLVRDRLAARPRGRR